MPRRAGPAIVACLGISSENGWRTIPLSGSQQNQGAAVWEPQAADGRLAHTAGANPAGVFTSDLSVSEYVLLGEAGFEPLGFVVGSSIYHVGLQAGRWSQNQELQVLTQAMYNARELAMARTVPAHACGVPGNGRPLQRQETLEVDGPRSRKAAARKTVMRWGPS